MLRTVVAGLIVTRAGVLDVLAPKSASPPKKAPMELTPNGSVVTSMLVEVTPPVVVSVDEPIGAPLSVKVTLPEGFAVPALAATVAVNETGSPVVNALDDAVTDVIVGCGATVSVRAAVEGRKSALPV
jgi:hypothetical protein